VAVALVLVSACSAKPEARGPRVVASFYPLAWAAGSFGTEIRVEDLTPPGGEPHELQLTARQRLDVQDAALVILLGKGFQPEVERAAKDSNGKVLVLLDRYTLLPSKEEGLEADPHIWLDPVLMGDIVGRVADALMDVDPANKDVYLREKSTVQERLIALDEKFRAQLSGCSLDTLVTTHEAFGYLARRYKLTEVGLTGVTPEAEPSARRIQQVRDAVRRGEAGAVFYEDTDEGRRIGRSVASDVGAKALPLNTLESDPAPKDYITQMESNLASLKDGLRCR
jgi:zinc transport system substrate-binding protein